MPRKPYRKPSKATYDEDGEPNRCRAKSKSSGERCTKTVVPGRTVCRYHGGLGGRPPSHGRYSLALGRFREAYESSLEDPSLLDLRETLALLDLVVRQAAERAGTGDTPELRSRALELLDGVREAPDPSKAAAKLNELRTLLEEGVDEDKALEALSDAAEKLARRQEKAWSIKLDAAQAINARDLVVVLGSFADVVMEEADRETAARIVRRIDTDVLGASGPAARIQAGL